MFTTDKKKTNTSTRIKKSSLIVLTAMMAMLSATALSSCGCENSAHKTATADEVATTEVPATVETLGETDQAVIDSGLTVNENGDITDEDGKKVEVSEDGKVEVKTADGKTVKVDAQKVKTANENKEKVDSINKAAAETKKNNTNSGNSNGNNNSGNSKSSGSTQTSKTSQTSKSTQTSKTQSSQTSKTQSSKTQSSQSSKQTSQSSGGGQSSKPSQQSSKTQTTTVDPHAGKTWHEAEYKTVNHPAETKKVWVVDKEAYSYEETVYKTVYKHLCWGCDADVGAMSETERDNHMIQHHLKGEETGFRYAPVQVPNGTKTVNVPEEGHYETVTVKEAWTEKVLVREAGWY